MNETVSARAVGRTNGPGASVAASGLSPSAVASAPASNPAVESSGRPFVLCDESVSGPCDCHVAVDRGGDGRRVLGVGARRAPSRIGHRRRGAAPCDFVGRGKPREPASRRRPADDGRQGRSSHAAVILDRAMDVAGKAARCDGEDRMRRQRPQLLDDRRVRRVVHHHLARRPGFRDRSPKAIQGRGGRVRGPHPVEALVGVIVLTRTPRHRGGRVRHLLPSLDAGHDAGQRRGRYQHRTRLDRLHDDIDARGEQHHVRGRLELVSVARLRAREFRHGDAPQHRSGSRPRASVWLRGAARRPPSRWHQGARQPRGPRMSRRPRHVSPPRRLR